MSQYANLKAAIAANVYENHNNQVTANMVKSAMNAMTDSLGAGYQYLGVAVPAASGTYPASPDQKVFYIASQPGTYTDFGLVVNDGEVAVLKYDTAWHKEVTGAATAAQVTELGQHKSDNLQISAIKNIKNIVSFDEGKYVTKQGDIEENEYFKVSPIIQVAEGQKLVIYNLINDNPNFTQSISSYDNLGNYLADKSVGQITTSKYVFIVPSGVNNVILTGLLSHGNSFVRVFPLEETNGTVTSLIDNDFNQNIVYAIGGNVEQSTAYHTTDYIPIVGLKSMSVCGSLENPYIYGIVFFDANLKFISGIYNVVTSKTDVYDMPLSSVPSNAIYCRVTSEISYSDYNFVQLVHDNISYINQEIRRDKRIFWKKEKVIYSNKVLTLNTDEYLQIEDAPSVRNDYVINAFMNFETFGTIVLHKGIGAYYTGKIMVDNTNLCAYSTTGSGAFNTYPHGLQLDDFLNITVAVKNKPMQYSLTGVATITLVTANGTFVQEVPWMGGDIVSLISENGNYTNVEISLSTPDKDNMIFADSYADFWTPYLFGNIEPNILIDSFSGRNSYNAWLSLNRELLTHLPKRIIWAMGMNDGDTNDVVNVDWKYYFDKVVELCDAYGIEPVFVTIPNTPIITNYYKNEVIKNSGKKYIDIARVVGAENIGSSWYAGLLGGDNVHPSDIGSKLIAQYLTEFMI